MEDSSLCSWLLPPRLPDLLPIIPSSFRFSSSRLCSRLGGADVAPASVSASASAVAVEDMRKVANDVAVAAVAVAEEVCGTKASTPYAESNRAARADWSLIVYLYVCMYVISSDEREKKWQLQSRNSM
jgi:hypothetical protein